MTESTVTKRFRIWGSVQGVYFRASARNTARQLGLSGWVRNIADGSVESLVTGPENVVREYAEWLGRGPDGATVTKVDESAEADLTFEGFEILRSH